MTDIFEVQQILASKKSKGMTLYKVRWRTFGPEEDTWEPVSHLKGCEELLAEFLAKKASKTTTWESQLRVVNRTVTNVPQTLKLKTVIMESPEGVTTSCNSDTMTVRDGRGEWDDHFLRRSAPRERFTTPKVLAGSQVKRKRTERNAAGNESDDAPMSSFLAGLCILFIVLAIFFVYFT